MQPKLRNGFQLHECLDVVDGIPDAIGELRDFLHFCCSSNRSVGVRLDSANVDYGGSVGQQVLNLNGEADRIREMRRGPTQLVDILVRGPCVRAATT